MLPVFVATLAAVVLELCMTSPVYNMQPAYITANIGTGRNIRNLPCISRKNNQSGVCMFAIDCLKSNGTHLGTCIDRFYFGSCCHIETLNDIINNTIDDIIPSREPPQRLSSTIKPITTTSNTSTKLQITNTTASTSTTTSTTLRTTTTATRPSSSTSTSTSTTTIKPSTSKDEITTVSYRLTTFQSVDGSLPSETTTPTTTSTTTTKISTTSKIRPKPSKTTQKPQKPSTKPFKTSTRRTTTTTSSTTRRPTKTRKPETTSTFQTTTTARKPNTTINTTSKPKTSTTTTTTKPKTSTTTTKPLTTHKIITKKPQLNTKPTKKVTTTTTESSSVKPSPTTTTEIVVNTNLTQVLTPVNGNVATNEIVAPVPSATTQEPSSTTKGSIVTWTVGDGSKNATTPIPTVNTTAATNTSEDWRPITTPDGWVLIPSVASTIISTGITATTITTGATEQSTQSVSTASITSTTLNSSTTEEVTTHSTPTVTGGSEIRPVNMSDFTDVCGRRMFPEARIVGGEKSSFGKWPWQISLRQWRTSTYLHKCGAALLNENWAITAAHCVDNVPPSDLLLRLGEHDLSTESEPYLHQERRVQIVASHPQFDPRTFEYDLALLRFYEPVTFQPNILPVCVPQVDESFVGRTAYVTGWGRLYEDGPLPSVLQEVSVPVINNSVCESMYRSAGYIEHIPHIFICAGWRRGGFDSCEGDSGGPMVIQRDDKRFLLAGVISWGIGCAEPNQPGVYTRISEFRDWINQILQF